MMRVKPEDVRAIITLDVNLQVDPFIVVANALTDFVVSRDTNGVLTDSLQKNIEQYLAAFFSALKDQQYANKNTGRASAQFQTGQPGPGAFDCNDWGRTAMMMDITGTLSAINEGAVNATFIYLGDDSCAGRDYWAGFRDACQCCLA